MKDNILKISNETLQLDDIKKFIESPTQITIDKDTIIKIDASRQVIETILKSDNPVYGVNTGFGSFSETRIEIKTVAELQRRLVLSHAAGVGRPVPLPIVRLMMLLKIKSLSLGYSGCRFKIVETLIQLINNNVLPSIPEQGSVGASGDLAPLAHMALVLIGEGSAFIPASKNTDDHTWKEVSGSEALEFAGIKPIVLEAKEGLAILNGTQAMTAYAVFAIIQTQNLLKVADIVGAMSVEALLGTLTPFDDRIQKIRNHPGQSTVADNIRKILADSPIVTSHKYSHHKVQDAYSLRCIPQVHGAVRDTATHAESVLLHEVNGVTDNPLVFPENNDVLSGGNFHGAPVAQISDFLSIALTDLSSISERRIEHMLDPSVSQLPAFLTGDGGLNSGFMIAHVTSASLVSENKTLSHPSSVDSIPTSANKEDHVSMGLQAARKTFQITQNLEFVLAIEFLCACQALEFRAPLIPAKPTHAALKILREMVPTWSEDRLMHTDIMIAQELIKSGKLVASVENESGLLS